MEFSGNKVSCLIWLIDLFMDYTEPWDQILKKWNYKFKTKLTTTKPVSN